MKELPSSLTPDQQAGAERSAAGRFVDLHCHWIAGIDDGARSMEEGVSMLRGLRALGFGLVVATPHMRPSLFDNTKNDIENAWVNVERAIRELGDLPGVGLGCEHFLDDVIYQRLRSGSAVPYPGGRSVLIEFPSGAFPLRVTDRLCDLRVHTGLLPVIAHPERYRPVWKESAILDELLDAGIALLLDIGALAGKYGRLPRRAAEDLVERGAYRAACSDAHRPSDLDDVAQGVRRLVELVGKEEAQDLLSEGPRSILEGVIGS
jgi:protein-tyrosine phosphatase